MRYLLLLAFLSVQMYSHAQKFQMSSGNISTFNSATSLFLVNDTNYLLAYATDRGFRFDTVSSQGVFISGQNYQCSHASAGLNFRGAAVDSTGAKYVYGSCNYLPSAMENQAIIYKLNPGGSVAWKNTVTTLSPDDEFQDVYISRSGSVYAVGKGYNDINYTQPMLAKFASNGQLQFANIYFSDPQTVMNNNDRIRIFAVNDTDLFIVGSVGVNYMWGATVFITKMDTLGNVKWTKFTNATKAIELKDIAVNDTSVYLTGGIRQTAAIDDIFLMNINFAGHTNWLRSYGNSQDEEGWSCAIQPDGKILIGGRTNLTTPSYFDFVFIQTDSDGNELNARHLSAGSSRDGYLTSILPIDSIGAFMAFGTKQFNVTQSLYLESGENGSGCNGTVYYLGEKFFFPPTDSCNTSTVPRLAGQTPHTLIRSAVSPMLNSYACNSSCQVNSSINPFPHNFCIGDTLFISAQDHTLLSYSWVLDDTLIASSDSVNYHLVYPGTHKLKLVVSDNTCSDSSTVYFNVKQSPLAQYSLLRHYHLLSFTNTSPNADYVNWKFSDGTSSTSNFFKYNFKDTGFVYYQLKAFNVCGEDSISERVYVNDSISPSFLKAYDLQISTLTVNDFTLTPDGGSLAGGRGLNGNYHLVKTDLLGNIDWCNEAGLRPIRAICATDDLGCVYGSAENAVIRISKLDSLGNGVWTIGSSGDEITDVVELPNHDIVVTGRINSNAGGLVVCINRFGIIKWCNVYTDIRTARGVAVQDHALYIYGETSSSTVGVMKLNFLGHDLWSKNYSSGLVEDHVVLNENKMVFSGKTIGAWLFCLDTMGTVQWSKEYPVLYMGDVATNNNKLYLAANTSNPNTAPTRVLVLDSIGNPLGSINYYWNTLTPSLFNIAFNYEGQLAAVGRLTGYDMFLAKQFPDHAYACFSSGITVTATNTTPVVTQGLGVTNPFTLYYYSPDLPMLRAMSVITNCSVTNCFTQPSFNYTFSAPTINFTNTSSGQITSVLWDFGDGQYSTQNNPSHTYWLPGQYNICLHVYTACDSGSVCQTMTVLITGDQQSQIQNDFSTFPNPANDILNISFGSKEIHTVTVIDASGRCLITEQNIISDKLALDVSILSNGIYFLKVDNLDGSTSSQKIIILK
jgi:PKD repeat protein